MSEDPMIGRTLADRYRIDDLVARGGMARVYRASDVRLQRDVAVKVLSAPYASDPEFTEQFLAEARAAASLSHPSLVHVYDSGSDGDAHYIVMELLDRHRSLRQTIESRGPLPRDEVQRIGVELLAGLRVVHDRELVHCDVKSANVMLGPGAAKLIDFGIARPPHDGLAGDTSIGSLQFMSPEQLHGVALTPASDLFSLGVVLYEALTGRVPYPGRTPEEVSAAHRSATVQPPSALVDGVPGRLDDVIVQALRPSATSRFHSADAMRRALESIDPEADETRVVSVPGAGSETPASRPASGAGYVPPAAAPGLPPGRRSPVPDRAQARRGGGRRTRRLGSPLRFAGPLLVLAVAGIVAAFVIGQVFQLGGGGSSASPSPASTSSAAPGTVIVPETVGRSTPDAIAAAQAEGLNWTVQCAQDPAQPEGIIGQEPPAGTSVAPGSRFTMFSARISDCR
ncbi:MAG: protein kinase domain-containing protein [Candidatus Limnocylindria bacterium]